MEAFMASAAGEKPPPRGYMVCPGLQDTKTKSDPGGTRGPQTSAEQRLTASPEGSGPRLQGTPGSRGSGTHLLRGQGHTAQVCSSGSAAPHSGGDSPVSGEKPGEALWGEKASGL